MAASHTNSCDERKSPPPAPPSGLAKFEPPTIRTGGAPLSCLQGPTVHIEVGVAPDVDNLLVHEKLLCRYSVFFRTALKGNFKEAKTKKISLPDEDPYLFLRVIRWLYTGEIDGGHSVPTPSEMDLLGDGAEDEEESEDDEEDEEESNITTYRLINLWVLGDKFQMPALQNAATRGLIEDMVGMCDNSSAAKDFPETTLIEHVYANTLPGSPLRSLIVDMAILSKKRERVRSIMETTSPEIVLAMAKRSFHFWVGAEFTAPDPYVQLRRCWQSYGVGDGVAEKDLFTVLACPSPAACRSGPWGKPCARCERIQKELAAVQWPVDPPSQALY